MTPPPKLKSHYDTLLANAPDHHAPEFLTYLKDNNPLVYEDDLWLIIENAKYHTPEKPHLTAFAKTSRLDFSILRDYWGNWEWRKKSAEKQTVKRFHIHLMEP